MGDTCPRGGIGRRCRKYWREYFADPDDRRQVLDELADMIVKKIRNIP